MMDTKELLKGDYLEKNASTSDSIAGLKELYTYLSKHKQAVAEKETKPLNKIASMLIRPTLMNSDNDELRILLACCIAEIIRIYAPEAPYHENALKKNFKLFLKELSGFDTRKNGKYYSALLNNLASVKAFLLVIDLDMALVRQTFTQFLQLPWNNLTNQDQANLYNILSLCITTLAEDDDLPDEDILQTILINILPKMNKRGQATDKKLGYTLAKNLILNCSAQLQPGIVHFLREAIEQAEEATHLHSHYHTLIEELNLICPSVLSSILPRLENELSSANVKVRLRVVKMLRNLVKNNSQIYQNFVQLYDNFLNLHSDANLEIREVVVKATKTLADVNPAIMPQITPILLERVIDVHENIRKAAVDVVLEIATTDIDLVSVELLEQAAQRIIDTKSSVSYHVFDKLTALFNAIDPDEMSVRDYDAKISWIPKKIICCYHYPMWETRHCVERILDEEFLPTDPNMTDELGDRVQVSDITKIRSAALIDLLFKIIDTPQVVTAYQKLLTETVTFQGLVESFLKSINGSDVFQEPDEALLHKIRAYFPNCPNIQEHLSNLAMLTPKAIKQIELLLHHDASSKKKIKAKQALLSLEIPYGEEKTLSSDDALFYEAFVSKLSVHVTPGMIHHMFSHIRKNNQLPDSGVIPVKAQQMFRFLQILAPIVPHYFHSCSLELKAMLEDNNPALVDIGLSLLVHTAHVLPRQVFTSSILQVLVRFCEQGTCKEAKQSIRTLCKIYQDDATTLKTTLSAILNDLQVHIVSGGKPSERFSTIMCSLATIAQSSHSAFAEFADLNVNFSKNLFREGNQFDCKSRVYGIHLLVNYLLGLDKLSAVEHAKPIIELLVGNIENVGSIEEEEVDSSKIRKHSAVGLIKLAHKSYLEALITNEHFLILTRVARDPCYEVRAAVMEALFQGCKTLALHRRYMAFMVLFSGDPNRLLLKRLKETFQLLVKIRRDITKKDPKLQPISPDLIIPYVLYYIAHQFDFEKGAPEYLCVTKYLQFLTEQLKTTNNASYLFHYFDRLRRAQEKRDNEEDREENKQKLVFDERLYTLCEIGKLVIKSKSPKKWESLSNSFAFSIPLFYSLIHPNKLEKYLENFRLPESFQVCSLQSRHPHDLAYPNSDIKPYSIAPESTQAETSPHAVISPKKPVRKSAPAKAKTTGVKRKPGKSKPEPSAKRKKVAEEEPPTPPRKSSRRTKTVSYEEKSSSSEEDEDESGSSGSEEEDDEEAPPPPKKVVRKTAKTKKGRKEESEEEEE